MFASPADLGRSKYVRTTVKRLSRSGLARSRSIPAGSTLFVCIGSTIGKVGLATEELATNQQINSIIPGAEIDSEYLYYAATTLSSVVRSRAGEQAVPLVNKSEFSAFEILLPRSDEQCRIASSLRDADDLIAALERMIAKKQAIARGVIQELLTGRTRLPGYSTQWRQARVADLLEFKNGLNKASRYFGSGTPIVNFMDVMNGPIVTARDVGGKVTLTRDEIKRFSARRGDIFFTRTSEVVEEVGTAAALIDYIPHAVFSGFILRGRPRTTEVDSRFLAHLFQLAAVRKQVLSTATYTTRALTNGGSLGRVTVNLPAVEEQSAIADVIADIDHEIGLLRERLAKARDVKLGMARELLTGHTRLPAKECAA